MLHECEISRIGNSFTGAVSVGGARKNRGGAVVISFRLVWNVFHDCDSFFPGCERKRLGTDGDCISPRKNMSNIEDDIGNKKSSLNT
jgi:hypothetical protein